MNTPPLISAGEAARRISAIGDLTTPAGVFADDRSSVVMRLPEVRDVVEYAAHFGVAVYCKRDVARARFEYAGVTVSVYAPVDPS